MSDITKLHAAVDRMASQLSARHGARLKCGRGCAACCVDGLTVFEIEARNIQHYYPELLRQATPHPAGACAFLDHKDNSCRIYDARPYVCRTQGLPLRWLEETDDAEELYELRDICPLNEAGTPVEELPEEDCWTIGPFEQRLAQMQMAYGDGHLRRVALRDLFVK